MSIEEVKNEQLGEVRCPTPDCGQVAYVFKNKRNYLYVRCPDCGCIQPTGAAAQAYFSRFQPIGSISQKEAEKPVEKSEKTAATEPEKSEQAADFVPEPEAETPKRGKGGLLLGLAVSLVAVALGLAA